MLRIQAFGHKCLRRLLGIYWSDHIPNKEVCERTNHRENFMSYIVMKRQHTWLGHVLRMEPGRLPLVSLQAQFLDTRKRGGQRTRWVDSVLKFSGLSMLQALRLAPDRVGWRVAFHRAND